MIAANEAEVNQKNGWSKSDSKGVIKLKPLFGLGVSQPRHELTVDRVKAGQVEFSPIKRLQMCRQRSSSSPCDKNGSNKRSKSPTKSPKPVVQGEASPCSPP